MSEPRIDTEGGPAIQIEHDRMRCPTCKGHGTGDGDDGACPECNGYGTIKDPMYED